jgi:hypothetical protein
MAKCTHHILTKSVQASSSWHVWTHRQTWAALYAFVSCISCTERVIMTSVAQRTESWGEGTCLIYSRTILSRNFNEIVIICLSLFNGYDRRKCAVTRITVQIHFVTSKTNLEGKRMRYEENFLLPHPSNHIQRKVVHSNVPPYETLFTAQGSRVHQYERRTILWPTLT